MNNKRKKALIIVDVQNDFCEGGSLAVPNANEILSDINMLIEDSRFDAIILTQDYHPIQHISFASRHNLPCFSMITLQNGQQQQLWPDHCVQDSYGSQIHQNIKLNQHKHYLIKKGTNKEIDSYSGFGNEMEDTNMNQLLIEQAIQECYIVGLALDFCVKATAIDAYRNGYSTFIILDFTRSIDIQGQNNIINSIRDQGVIVDSWNHIQKFLN